MSLNLANTSSSFELPDTYRVIIGCGEKILAIWVEHEGANPVIVTNLRNVCQPQYNQMIPNSRKCASIDLGVRPRSLSFYPARMLQRKICSRCQVRHSVLPLAIKQLNRVVLMGGNMKEPFDLGVHGSQVYMRRERRQLLLQRCRGHVTPIS